MLLTGELTGSPQATAANSSLFVAGWKKTYYGYFEEDVRVVLSNVLAALEAKPSRRFIWSEVSYLAAWVDADPATRQPRVQRLVDQGQLEFVGASSLTLESKRIRCMLSVACTVSRAGRRVLGGGWVQADATLNTLDAMLGQQAEGAAWVCASAGSLRGAC